MKKRIFILTLSLCLTAGLTISAFAAQFGDVPAESWYHDAIYAVAEGGMMNGTSDTAFTPDGPATRGMVAVVLWRLSGSPAPKEVAAFPDVGEGDYYASAAAWAQETGVANGYGDGRFGGGDVVTREQLAVFLHRYAQTHGQEVATGVLTPYADADKVSTWAKDGMAHAVGSGLITGSDKNALTPQGTASRGQLAVMLQRLMTPAVG